MIKINDNKQFDNENHLQSQIFSISTDGHYASRLSQQPLIPNSFPITYIPNCSNWLLACFQKFKPFNRIWELDNYLVPKALIPFWTVQNKNGLVPSLENRQSSIFSSWINEINMITNYEKIQLNTKAGKNIYHTALRVKVVIGTPSSVFQTLADPSLEVEAKNSESRLEQGKKISRTYPTSSVSFKQQIHAKFSSTIIRVTDYKVHAVSRLFM